MPPGPDVLGPHTLARWVASNWLPRSKTEPPSCPLCPSVTEAARSSRARGRERKQSRSRLERVWGCGSCMRLSSEGSGLPSQCGEIGHRGPPRAAVKLYLEAPSWSGGPSAQLHKQFNCTGSESRCNRRSPGKCFSLQRWEHSAIAPILPTREVQ